MYLWLVAGFAFMSLLTGCSDKGAKSIDFGPGGDDGEYEEAGYQ